MKTSIPKVIWSDLYECYCCIYIYPSSGKWTIERFETQQEANDFKEEIEKPLLQYIK